ncbi:DUF3048 domain-containing protein [Fervidibacillus halotolerans]|uniref:DUF3048 domain-containing protein n=1 Tax=Fervidibacillus halotolerans TaxID=2980027 RepID=A0A9E8RY90_9BACI|nr:DUF3048 domain-containing protein [Fervidibacillus halotolerans]WAA12601.1 DUF3048 domain-containing protein [Fervidibacillus halotolerans]
MAKILKLFVMAVLVIVFTVACGKETETTKDQTNEPEKIEEPVVEEEPVLYQYPLTGIWKEEPSEHRAISVMINNHPAARPQSGLVEADVVYEILAEGGVTRFLAIYQSEMPEKFGPVRSARDYYIELAKGFDSLYIAHGYSPKAKGLLDSGYIDSINGIQYDGTLFKRASFRVAPHNSYISYDNIVEGAKKLGYSLDGPPESYSFLDEEDEVTGLDVQTITIDYSNHSFSVRYEYDPTSKTYRRYSADELTTDYDTGKEVKIANIFIVEMEHTIIDQEGRRAIDLTSGGKALLLQRGKLIQVEWKNVDGRIIPVSSNEEVSLISGKTWINVVPTIDQMVSYVESE